MWEAHITSYYCALIPTWHCTLFPTMENVSGKEAPPHIFYSQNKTLQYHLKEFSRKPERSLYSPQSPKQLFYIYIDSKCIPKTS